MSTEVAKSGNFQHEWLVLDLEGLVLGRAAARIAHILRGKHKAIYTPSVDAGDFVVVVNAEKVQLTGNKLADKIYYRHTGHPGGLREISAGKLLDKKPEELIKRAVRGMLPKNKLGRKLLKKLKVYAGPDHPHQAQQPKQISL